MNDLNTWHGKRHLADDPLRGQSYRNGLVSIQAEEGLEYKWMLHESKEWLEKAKVIQGSDWEWSKEDAPKVSYKFDYLGFRNDKSIKEISKDPNWWLFESACFGLGPGLDVQRTAPRMLEEYTEIPVYNMSLFGDRPELITNNILELSKRWINPPKKIILHISEHPTGSYRFENSNKVTNIDYPGLLLSELITGSTPDQFSWFENFEEQKMGEGHHRLAYNTIIKLCDVLKINLSWLYTGEVGDYSPVNYLKEHQDIIFCQPVPGSGCGSYNKETPFNERKRIVSNAVIDPITTYQPARGAEAFDVSRDLFHPGPESHKVMAQTICQHFLESKRNF